MVDANNLGLIVQREYDKERIFHYEKVNSIMESEELKGTNLVGLANALSDILCIQSDLRLADNQDNSICNELDKLIEKEDDKLKALILINKYSTEMLVTSMIARDVAKSMIENI